jgi:PAS domain S-box-containing protein
MGRCLYVNPRAVELLAQSAGALVGKTMRDIFPDIVGTPIEARLRAAEATSSVFEFETASPAPGRWSPAPGLPEPGRFLGLLRGHDRSQERRGGVATAGRHRPVVRRRHRRQEPQRDHHSWNAGAERLFGYTAAEAIGRSIRMIVPADRQAEEDEVLAKLQRGESIDHFETVRVRKDGTPVDISLSVSPVRNAAGHIIGASKIARDITERKRAEVLRAELLAAERTARARAELASAGPPSWPRRAACSPPRSTRRRRCARCPV